MRTKRGSFITAKFDPVLILGQIVCMQALFYVSLGCFMLVLDAACGRQLTVVQILSPRAASPASGGRTWWVPVGALFLAAIACSFGLVLVVGKARRCLDFSATVFIVHLVVASASHGVPVCCLAWWGSMIGSAILMAFVGEFLCMKRELRLIPIGRAPSFAV